VEELESAWVGLYRTKGDELLEVDEEVDGERRRTK
jgi:hypothetical protein